MAANIMAKKGDRSRRRRRGKAAVMAEINVTPFVDVMLVLLIIFMVAAPLLTVGIPIELPKTNANALPVEQEEPLAITLTSDDRILILKEEISESDLIPKLNEIMSQRSSRKLFLRADGSVSYGRVAQIMGALNAGGFSQIGLVTDPDGPTFGGTKGNSNTSGG